MRDHSNFGERAERFAEGVVVERERALQERIARERDQADAVKQRDVALARADAPVRRLERPAASAPLT